MVHFRAIALAFVAGALPQLVESAGLNTAAKAVGLKYFGTATDNPELSDQPYVQELSNTDDFGQITPGNSQKWGPIEPQQNQFSWAKGDAIVNLAQSNGQIMRCHNLVWHNQLPGWVSNGNWNNATLTAAMKNHITKVVQHYKGECYAWDVVNEALNEDGSYRNSIFYQHIGEAYIPIAFAAAAAADPDVKLYYNDYNIEYPGSKSTAAQNIVNMIKAYGVKVDGVGLQAHFISGSTPSYSSMVSNLKAFTALDVEVGYTELDIRMQLPSTSSKLAQQSTDYENTVKSCVDVDGCIGVTVWDWTDKYSWVPSVFSGYGAACPWDKNLQKKPAYDGILAGLGASSSPGSPTTTSDSGGSTSTGGSGQAAHWGQCGGRNWNGPTSCVSPYTCHKLNDWYSQCL